MNFGRLALKIRSWFEANPFGRRQVDGARGYVSSPWSPGGGAGRAGERREVLALDDSRLRAQRSADQEQARADDLSTQSASADQRANRARGSLAAATDAASRPATTLPGVTLASPPSDPTLLRADGRVAGASSTGRYVNVFA